MHEVYTKLSMHALKTCIRRNSVIYNIHSRNSRNKCKLHVKILQNCFLTEV